MLHVPKTGERLQVDGQLVKGEGSMRWYVSVGKTVPSIVFFPALFDMTPCSSRRAAPELNLWQLQTVGGPVLVVAVLLHSL